jgi:hypothetical protein
MEDVWVRFEAYTATCGDRVGGGSGSGAGSVAADLVGRDIAQAGVRLEVDCLTDVGPVCGASYGGECVCGWVRFDWVLVGQKTYNGVVGVQRR